MLDGRLVQYIRLHYFSSKATRQFTQAMQAGERQQVAGYVLDLRNNPGARARGSLAASPCCSKAIAVGGSCKLGTRHITRICARIIRLLVIS